MPQAVVTRMVLFDLDGTLVDTAQDLGRTLNEMRRRRGLAELSDQVLRAQASHGTRGLLKTGFGLDPGHPDFENLRQEFLALYERNLTTSSLPFPGMTEVLAALEERAIGWGVVTNKPARFTVPLLDYLGLRSRAACVVSGDTCPQPKPHPGALIHACRVAGVDPAHCLYVGDAQRDVQAATAAGMPSIVALYGYLSAEDRPQEWGASGFIERPADLLDYLATGS